MDYSETCFQIRLVSAFFVVALTFAGPKMDLKEDPIDASGFGDGLAFVFLVLIWSFAFLLADHSQQIEYNGDLCVSIYKGASINYLIIKNRRPPPHPSPSHQFSSF